eukprot:281674_1
MTARARLQNANDSKSLWNYTLSPGWGSFDCHILRLAIMRHGCGAWRSIGRHFPLKNCNQLNLQTQRLFGQQALAEFQKVHIDPHRIRQINDKIEGFRKNNCLINTGNNLSVQEREARRTEHKKKYGIPEDLYDKLQIPVVLDAPKPCKTLIDKIEKLRELYRCVYDIELRQKQLKENDGKNAANIKLKAKAKKTAVQLVTSVDKEDQDVEMANNNSNTNEKKSAKKEKKKSKKSAKKKKKKSSRKRKKMDTDDDAYNPQPPKKKAKTN